MKEAERLAERLEELLAKATPPVWIADGKDIVHADGPQAWGKKEVANVALIVEAVNALPTLLARIAALEWRPISTWPGTDEAYALVCNAGSVYPIIAGYDSNDEEWFSFNGYYEKFGKGPLVPDYWMPLPIPPATEALGKGSE